MKKKLLTVILTVFMSLTVFNVNVFGDTPTITITNLKLPVSGESASYPNFNLNFVDISYNPATASWYTNVDSPTKFEGKFLAGQKYWLVVDIYDLNTYSIEKDDCVVTINGEPAADVSIQSNHIIVKSTLYEAQAIIADILATVSGGFPTTEGTGWASENGHKIFVDSDQLKIDNGSGLVFSVSGVVTKNNNVYSYAGTPSLAFTMNNDVLESIVVSDSPGLFAEYNGTYSSNVIKVEDVLKNYPTSPKSGWVNSNGATIIWTGSNYALRTAGEEDINAFNKSDALNSNYELTICTSGTATFNLTEGVATSITISGLDTVYNGEYIPQTLISKFFPSDFPESGGETWVDGNGHEAYKFRFSEYADYYLYIGGKGTVDVETDSVKKTSDTTYKYSDTDYDLIFTVEDDKLVSITLENGTGSFEGLDGTYAPVKYVAYLYSTGSSSTPFAKYKTLAEAIENANNGNVIELVEDCNEDVILPEGIIIYVYSNFTGTISTDLEGMGVMKITQLGPDRYEVKQTYSITYKDQGDKEFSGVHEEGYPTYFFKEDNAYLYEATKKGFKFEGWYDNKECTGEAIEVIYMETYSDPITLYAKWTLDVKTIGDALATAVTIPSTTNPNEVPDGAWIDGNGHYMYISANNDGEYVIFTNYDLSVNVSDIEGAYTVASDGQGNFTWTYEDDSRLNIKFNMTGDALTSVVVSGLEILDSEYEALNGTYVQPPEHQIVVTKMSGDQEIPAIEGEDETEGIDYFWSDNQLHILGDDLIVSGIGKADENIRIRLEVENITFRNLNLKYGIDIFGDSDYPESTLDLVLVGTNKIGREVAYDGSTQADDYSANIAMDVRKNLIIDGSGTLTIYDSQEGIQGTDANLTFKNSFTGTVTIEDAGFDSDPGPEPQPPCAISLSNGSLTIDGGTLNLTSYNKNAITADSIDVNGGTVIAKGGIQAMSVAPTLGFGVSVSKASTNFDGSTPVETYDSDDIDSYLYMMIETASMHKIELDSDPKYIGYIYSSSLDLSHVIDGTSVDLQATPSFYSSICQIDYYEISGIGENNITFDGAKMTFDMPASNVSVKAIGHKPINSVDVTFAIPEAGDTTVSTPTVGTSVNYKLSSSAPIQIVKDNLPVDISENPFEAGEEYLAIICLDANDGYSFKYEGNLDAGSDSAEVCKYNVTTKINNETITSWQTKTDLVTGYTGTKNSEHDSFVIYYYFTVPVEYEITEGDNVTINVDKGEGQAFRSSAAYNKFVKVMINGDELDPSHYVVTEGSTVVTLKSSYLSTLPNGTYNLSIVSTDGYADTTFTITRTSPSPTPHTNGKHVIPNTFA